MPEALPGNGSASYAYDLEGQALFVSEVQRENGLRADTRLLNSKRTVREWGAKWIILDKSTTLFANHCTSSYRRFKTGDAYTVIRTQAQSDCFTFSQIRGAIAGIITERGILYLSPGFDLEEWQSRQQSLENIVKTARTFRENVEGLRNLGITYTGLTW